MAVVTGVAVAIDALAPAAGLGMIYLVAVAFVAMRHGELAAFVTALVAAAAFKFFFLAPRYSPGFQDFANVVVLLTLVGASIVVGRLAERVRRQAREAREAALLATARERENALIATAASALLEGGDVQTGRPDARVALTSAPSPKPGEMAVRLPTSTRPAWLYVPEEAEDLEAQARVASVLGHLVDVAVERQRLTARATEAEATKRAEVAKTAILHAISHDLRTPLTAIILASDTMRQGPLEPAMQAEVAEVIDSQAKRLARLIDDLLDMSRIDAGAVNPQTEWCDLHALVAGVAADLEQPHPVQLSLGLLAAGARRPRPARAGVRQPARQRLPLLDPRASGAGHGERPRRAGAGASHERRTDDSTRRPAEDLRAVRRRKPAGPVVWGSDSRSAAASWRRTAAASNCSRAIARPRSPCRFRVHRSACRLRRRLVAEMGPEDLGQALPWSHRRHRGGDLGVALTTLIVYPLKEIAPAV